MDPNQVFTDLLKASHEALAADKLLQITFENAFRDSLCNFNFARFIDAHCTITLAQNIQAYQYACTATITAVKTAMASPRCTPENRELYSTMLHQICPPIHKTLLKSLGSYQTPKVDMPKASQPSSKPKSFPTLKRLPKAEASRLAQAICESINTEIFYPVLCTTKGCAYCKQLAYNLPLTPCTEDCKHPSFGTKLYPHLANRFAKLLLANHGQEWIDVKENVKPGITTYRNPLRGSFPPKTGYDTDSTIRSELESMTLDQPQQRQEDGGSDISAPSVASTVPSIIEEPAVSISTNTIVEPKRSTITWSDEVDLAIKPVRSYTPPPTEKVAPLDRDRSRSPRGKQGRKSNKRNSRR